QIQPHVLEAEEVQPFLDRVEASGEDVVHAPVEQEVRLELREIGGRAPHQVGVDLQAEGQIDQRLGLKVRIQSDLPELRQAQRVVSRLLAEHVDVEACGQVGLGLRV